jgi:hypothetical protein
MPLPAASNDFQAAVRAGDYGAADRLLVELRREVELAWTGAAQAERRTMAAEVLDLLDWAKLTVLVRRSHMQRKLVQIRREGAYHFPAGSRAASGARGAGQIEFVG